MGCVFCEIIEKKKPAKIFLEDDNIIVFADILPRAAVHLLVCPKEHYERFVDLPENAFLEILQTVKTVTARLGLENNFRLVLNNGAQAGQIIGHIHLHYLSNQAGVKVDYK